MTSDYIQSVWWALSEMWKQGLVYKGFRVAPYCPRCATPLSSHELAQGYRDNVPDPSVFVRFRLKNDPKTSILAWTTTPWTLPGNVALAVHRDVTYVKVRQGQEFLVLAEAPIHVLDGDYEIVERMKGTDLVGLDYEPLYRYSVPEEGKAHYVVDADFVSTEEGTGVVHTSALYGVDDLRLCQEKGIPFRHTVGLDGKFLPYVEKFAGLHVKGGNPLIAADRHRPDIDKVAIPCPKCGGVMHRIPEVLDTWFDSGRCPSPSAVTRATAPRSSKKHFRPTSSPRGWTRLGVGSTRCSRSRRCSSSRTRTATSSAWAWWSTRRARRRRSRAATCWTRISCSTTSALMLLAGTTTPRPL